MRVILDNAGLTVSLSWWLILFVIAGLAVWKLVTLDEDDYKTLNERSES